MRLVFFTQAVHPLFNYILEYPPQGYRFVFTKKGSNKQLRFSGKIRQAAPFKNNSTLGLLRYQLRWYTDDILKKTPTDVDLIFSPHRLIYCKKKPWVVMIEHVGDLCPIMYDIKNLWLYRSFIEKVLGSSWCKKIMPYLDTEKMSLFELDCGKFKDKIEVVNLAVTAKKFEKEYGKDKVSLLFLGTARAHAESNFEERGGKEVLEAFKILNRRYKNLELVIRSSLPPYIYNEYSQILAGKNVKIFDQVLSGEELDHIMKSASILLFPGHVTPALTFLDAMSYELPVVATNWRGNYEMVKDGETGFLIKPPFGLNPILLESELVEMISKRSVDMCLVEELVEKTSILIEDEALRRRMGIAGRREIETDKFSIKNRNQKLKRIFDEAID